MLDLTTNGSDPGNVRAGEVRPVLTKRPPAWEVRSILAPI